MSAPVDANTELHPSWCSPEQCEIGGARSNGSWTTLHVALVTATNGVALELVQVVTRWPDGRIDAEEPYLEAPPDLTTGGAA